MKLYRKQPIEAEQFDGSNEMVDEYDIEVVEGDYADDYSMPEAGPATYFRYFMPSGYNEIYVGDWIATGVNGEHWPIKNDVFKKTYAELPVIPKNVAERIITEHSLNDLIPSGGIYRAMIQTVVYGYQKGDIGDWIVNHSDVFARAWLDGYVVEEDK
ncbi:hypothetical protein AYO51_15900 [Lactiplantibacillus plantarum]|uniref:DUF1642 domain-containing protein n=1 Tax=Lactiplantibacillus plantarum TaxID=1590 RepID=UPI000787755E|nr:DUF1642 domain-containing protein [Lactiplantibacillus plantarum]KYK53598.1 hypothetical protein AYO51_15900 [Lactiplantibacillus plantarum]KYM70889.1 hypothetical protein AZJ01_17585 [Lactiplantibacillus plantarum]